MEAKQLADVLNVSASYLLCLTDNPDGEIHLSENNSQYFVPLFNFNTAHLIKENQYNTAEMVNILTDTKINKKIDANCFAMKIEDASMNPIFEENDLIIVSPETKPQPGQFVIAYLPKSEKSILRRYSESDNGLYQLHPNSDLWAVTNVKKASEAQIIGVVIEHRRYYWWAKPIIQNKNNF